jgi:hypothetical protein
MACISWFVIFAYIRKDNLFVKHYKNTKPVCTNRTFAQIEHLLKVLILLLAADVGWMILFSLSRYVVCMKSVLYIDR